MASKFRGVKWNNARFPSTIKIRRSIDLAELGDFGSITENSSDLPTAGATHRKATGGSTSATRGHTDLQSLFDTVVDNQDMGSIGDATTTHRVWSAMGAITDIVTEAPTGILAPLVGAYTAGAIPATFSSPTGTSTIGSGIFNHGFHWDSTGTYYYQLNQSNSNIYRFVAATPWDQSTLTSQQTISAYGSSSKAGLTVSEDGLNTYHANYLGEVIQTPLSVAHDLSSAGTPVTASVRDLVASELGLTFTNGIMTIWDLSMSIDGTSMFALVVGDHNFIVKLRLLTPYDISTVEYADSILDWEGKDSTNNQTLRLTPNRMFTVVSGTIRYWDLDNDYELPSSFSADGTITSPSTGNSSRIKLFNEYLFFTDFVDDRNRALGVEHDKLGRYTIDQGSIESTGILDSAATSGGGSTQYDYTDVTAVTKSLEVEFYSNNPTGGYVNVGDRVAANSTHAFFLEGRQGYSEFIVSAVNLTTGTTDYTISPDHSNIPDNGIVANDSYVLIATSDTGKLYSTSTQQLVGTISTQTGHNLFKMTDNYVAMMSSNDINQIDVRELDPANNFPLVNSFTGSSSEQFGQNGRFDLSDTHIVIGAPGYTSDYQATDYQELLGKVEVFNIQSGVLEHTFYGRDGIHHTSTASSTTIRFGNRIAIDGDNVAINTKASNSVAEGFRVYNYKTGQLVTVGNRPTWGTNSSKYLNDLGNEAFAASGGLVFLYTGDLRDGSLYSPNQAVFVYNYSGEMVLRIDDPDISTAGQYYEYTYFGKSLAVSGDKLILGAKSYSTNTDAGGAQTAIGYQVGKGYIYDLTKTYAEV